MAILKRQMKLRKVFLAAVTYNAIAAAGIREITELNSSIKECGKTHLHRHGNTTVHESIELEADQDACIYKIKGSKRKIIEILDFELDLDCDEGEVILFAGDQQLGPYCNEEKRRRRRNAYGHSVHDLQGHHFNSNELDLLLA